ncbi:hypothetical protein ACFQ7F_43595 [Streptomyces sp. NPDC056486]|uniref:hypothetical protein n=1 Tax=Streptomyces sp. NPDC056486 TaxID=3345835 RepID=UPI0036AD53E0
MVRRSALDHDEECDLLTYDEGGHCTCPEERAPGWSDYNAPVHGEEPDPHDGRLAGPAMDW